jgi:hypothetical protein
MKSLSCIALLIAAAGCASSAQHNDDSDIVPPAQTIVVQQTTELAARMDALQTSMTELLERLDVMNDRIAKLESAPVPQPIAIVAPARTGEGAGAPQSLDAPCPYAAMRLCG